MIVQCKKCQTKFKFDETLIEREGVWVRCSQCKNVFFLDNPKKVETESRTEQARDIKGDAPTVQGQIFEDRIEEVKRLDTTPVKDIEEDSGDSDMHERTGIVRTEDEGMHDENEGLEEKVEKKQILTRGMQLIILFIILLIGGVYFVFFTGTGGQTSFERILGTSQKAEEVGPAQVDLTDVRQRLVNNATIGTIRVIEGIAINQSSFPMTRIKVRGEITDAYTVVLGVKESYCGNLLNDIELATMTEDQIQKELSNPQGSDVSNDRIAPKGQIPFMIVFTREPAGLVKTFVTPVGAERLLP
ncbi:MAG TPA: zinc-ribbon domain-containing protein [Syntrophales bacterium]|nr:zinc-ribbon domain-containing protein [Syntrophales bacterium]